MKTIQDLIARVELIQMYIQPLNHKLENSSLSRASRVSVEESIRELKVMWFDALCEYHAHPEYTGSLCYQKENNPYR